MGFVAAIQTLRKLDRGGGSKRLPELLKKHVFSQQELFVLDVEEAQMVKKAILHEENKSGWRPFTVYVPAKIKQEELKGIKRVLGDGIQVKTELKKKV